MKLKEFDHSKVSSLQHAAESDELGLIHELLLRTAAALVERRTRIQRAAQCADLWIRPLVIPPCVVEAG